MPCTACEYTALHQTLLYLIILIGVWIAVVSFYVYNKLSKRGGCSGSKRGGCSGIVVFIKWLFLPNIYWGFKPLQYLKKHVILYLIEWQWRQINKSVVFSLKIMLREQSFVLKYSSQDALVYLNVFSY